MPSSPARSMTAKVRYGLQLGSGHLNSALVDFSLPAENLGTLMSAERFRWPQQMYTGASYPGTSLLYELTVGLSTALISLTWSSCPAMNPYATSDSLYLSLAS